MSERVTIGVCVKNSEETIRQSIRSIIAQEYPLGLIQLIIVDGCSRDKTLPIINSEISKTRMTVETYSDKGEGLGTARQIVVNKAKGKYVIFVDADIFLFRDFVRNQVKFMEENTDFDIAFGRLMYQKGTLIATIWSLINYATGTTGLGSSICRFEALQQVGGFDTKIKGAAEDRDLNIRFKFRGLKGSVNDTARFFHKHRDNLRSLWVEQLWFGYGDHYFNHKYGSSIAPVWKRFPFVEFIYSLKLASKTFKVTGRRLSFLVLPLMVFGDIGWWIGFAKAHWDKYGH